MPFKGMFDLLQHFLLVALDREDVVGFVFDDFVGYLRLRAHGVYGDYLPLYVEHVKQERNRRYLVALHVNLQLPEHEPVVGRPCADHVYRADLVETVLRPLHRLPVYGYHLPPDVRILQRLRPLNEHTFEALGADQGKHPVYRVVGGYAVRQFQYGFQEL